MLRALFAMGMVVVMAAADDKQASRALTEAESRKPYVDALETSPEFKKIAERRNGTTMPLCQMVRLPAGKDKPEVVETLHFKYDEGVTIRTRIDAQKMIVLKTEKLRAYPTPLAAEELEKAVGLAREKSAPVNKIYGDAEGKPDVTALVPVISDAMSPRFGHRLVILSVGPKPPADAKAPPGKRVTVEIDLTDGTVTDPV